MYRFMFIRMNLKAHQSGFTLIEMMIVVVIMGIFAAIAIPSYRQYTIKNAESQALAKMKQTEIELTSWRATALTYKGFYPKQINSAGTVSYAYANSGTNTTIVVPDSGTTQYTIRLTADSAGATSLTTTASSTGNTWYMFATPNTTLGNYGARKILLTSIGLGCKSTNSSFTATSTCDTSTTGLDK